jgi:hypothetical protein
MSTVELSYFALRGVWSAGTDGWWAAGLDGWADAEPKPLVLYRP